MIQIRLALTLLLLSATTLSAAELLMPQGRKAYYSQEPIELAVVGMGADATATVAIVPESGATPIEVHVKDIAPTIVLPPYALSPANYTLQLEGKPAGKLIVARGVPNSTMLLGNQGCNVENVRDWNCNFLVGNAFSFGLLDGDLKPAINVRDQSGGIRQLFHNAVARDVPAIIYMYWTGVIAHQPWGAEKSWTDPPAVEAMRLFNFHVAQRLRPYRHSILYVGTIDEPGLPHGKTPAGGLASGFPRWDEQEWYETRGWKYTDDPGSRPDDDWMKYLTIRCAILKEIFNQAKLDLKSVWPSMVFSSDLYAPFAIMDGTDPLNQEVNDIPSTHVFADWGSGKLGVTSALYLEKAHNPSSKVTHAMNGQMLGENVPAPEQRIAYHLMLNAMLAAGLHDNWWLGTSGLNAAEISAVNDPALRLGPLFHEMSPAEHDVAVLWGFTEMGLRQKEIAAQQAKTKPGEKIIRKVTELPENTLFGKDGTELAVSAYEIGGNYRDTVLSAHQALMRAGYPAHIVHERLLPRGALKPYKTLVIAGQTYEFPSDVKQALAEFQSAGGRIIIDRSTTAKIDGAIKSEASFKDPSFRWRPFFLATDKFKTAKEGSYFLTNWFMDGQVREATPAIVETMKQTASKPLFKTDNVHLAAERHVAGEGALCMVINGYEKLPEIKADQKYLIYNYAPYETTFTFANIPEQSAVYCIEGIDWKQVRRLDQLTAPQTAKFAGGEMKLYLVAPRPPQGISVDAKINQGALEVSAQLNNLKMPWPITVTVSEPGGAQLFRIYRSMNHEGRYQETFAIGSNAKPGEYIVKIESPVAELVADAKVDLKPTALKPETIADAARVFDGDTIRSFLAQDPTLVIAYGADDHKAIAEKLAADLVTRGIHATVSNEKQVFYRAKYPRIWSPYATVYEPTGTEKSSEGMTPKVRVELHRDDQGRIMAMTPDGKNIGSEWRKPNTLVTVVGKGYLDWENRRDEVVYQPGCRFFVDGKKNIVVIKGEATKVKTTRDFRDQWSRPWAVLDQYQGGRQLPPQLPEAYSANSHLILLGDSTSSELVRVLQASELLLQTVDAKYPGPGKSLVSFVWSPFGVEKNVILIGANDVSGLKAGAGQLTKLASDK
jgi:hypothetical protein